MFSSQGSSPCSILKYALWAWICIEIKRKIYFFHFSRDFSSSCFTVFSTLRWVCLPTEVVEDTDKPSVIFKKWSRLRQGGYVLLLMIGEKSLSQEKEGMVRVAWRVPNTFTDSTKLQWHLQGDPLHWKRRQGKWQKNNSFKYSETTKSISWGMSATQAWDPIFTARSGGKSLIL